MGDEMDKVKGLTNQEVQEQMQLGHVNISPKPLVKTHRQIFCEHIFTLFNAYNFVIACALIYVQAWSSLFFVLIVTMNTIIHIYQDIRSRQMVARLNLIISPKTKVLREGQIYEIDNEDIVLHDVVQLGVNFITAPAEALGVLAHLKTRHSYASSVGCLSGRV